ncbi:MAG: methyl-accepting chemotaxis protein [Anaerolineae bacterium]|nr:methyl-accepting chemotaxis protein [Anaerolineae bacterium]
MNLFRNLKVGYKISLGFIFVLVLMGAIAAIALFQLNGIGGTVTDMADNLMVDQHLSQQLIAQILMVRFSANKYIATNDSQYMDQYKTAVQGMDDLIKQAEVEITDPERAAMLANLKTEYQNYQAAFLEVYDFINKRQTIKINTLDYIGPKIEDQLVQLQQQGVTDNNLALVDAVGSARTYMALMRLDVFKYMDEGSDDYATLEAQRYEQLKTIITTIDAQMKNENQKTQVYNLLADIKTYHTSFQNGILEDYAKQNSITKNKLDVTGPKIVEIGNQISDSVEQDLDARKVQTNDTISNTRNILIITLVVAILLGLFFGVVISRSITQPLGKVMQAAAYIARGELNRDMQINNIRSKDEMGEMAATFQEMVLYLQKMADAATSIAGNDLTIAVEPASRDDVLGNAFSQMVVNLRDLINQLSTSVALLNGTSNQLAVAAGQAGEAATQITATIQQVAKGISQQSESISNTANSITQTSNAVAGVAKGAQEQAVAVGKASQVTSEISNVIEHVAESARGQARDSAESVKSTDNSVLMVEDTIRGMQAIKNKVDLSTEKMKEMNERSNQIGAIVELIDDIASQTNLLALNAAIEAARAGEHGKGFAVVADEVRKLAEKSAAATREISGLVKGIRESVEKTLGSMAESVVEVERGVNLSAQSRQALNDLKDSAEKSRKSGEQIVQAAEQMSKLAGDLVMSVDSVSAVVEENTAATEEMAASSNEVSDAIENIASVSEENSASAEEISASSEEMTAQVAEVTSSAVALAEMARSLQDMVARFKTGENA